MATKIPAKAAAGSARRRSGWNGEGNAPLATELLAGIEEGMGVQGSFSRAKGALLQDDKGVGAELASTSQRRRDAGHPQNI